ncbi:virulence RhuM family protein [Halomonas sp. GXIMD04776]|uniref:virulence RhuM family protein n=1 Tax=Halomonas sp. GXIMD04776 TaxID=3415605 RepID=UPI003CBC7DF0
MPKDTERESVWLNLQQLSVVFGRDKSVISRHLRNIYKEGELEREATVAKNATVQSEGSRLIRRQIELYNLDAIISVGYRVNSRRAVQFRQWATRVLREHLTQGWTLNRQRFEDDARELEVAMALIRQTAQSPALPSSTLPARFWPEIGTCGLRIQLLS